MTIHSTTLSNRKPHLVRVLVVDDNPQVLHDLRQLLELSGMMEVVGEAESGLEAVRLAAGLSPDIIVMDLEMPAMDGYQATALIKAGQTAPRVVILSVHAGHAQEERARASGADAFVVKGADYQILLNAILGRDGSNNSVEKGEKS